MIRPFLLISVLYMVVASTNFADAETDTEHKEDPFRNKIVLNGGDPDGSTLHFENARVETVFGKQMLVAEQVLPDEDTPDDPSYYVTGVVHFIPWERIGALIVMPREMLGRRVDRRLPKTENGG